MDSDSVAKLLNLSGGKQLIVFNNIKHHTVIGWCNG